MGKGIDVVMKLEGGDALRKALKKRPQEFLAEMDAALTEETARLRGAAESETPAASGTLLMSLTTSSAKQPAKGRLRFAVAYTDDKAAAVHEGVHWGKHFEGTRGFKWFERVFNAFEQGFVQRVADRLRRLVGGGS